MTDALEKIAVVRKVGTGYRAVVGPELSLDGYVDYTRSDIAQAAAKADYNARILSALSIPAMKGGE